jgi:CxxC-x17-CxxC domain-containing protein
MVDFDRNFDRKQFGKGKFKKGRSGGFGRNRSDRFEKPRSFGGRDRGGRSSGFGSERRFEKHEATCDKCGKNCEVPFKPTIGKPIFCDDCFKSKSIEDGSRSGFGKLRNDENHDQINKKLDKIIVLLESLTLKEAEQISIEKPKNKKVNKNP